MIAYDTGEPDVRFIGGVAVGEVDALHGRLNVIRQEEQLAEEHAPPRIVDPRSELVQAMVISEIQHDGGSLVKHPALWRDHRRYITGRIDEEKFG